MTVRIGVTFTVLMGLLMIALSIPMLLMFRDYQYDKLQLSLERDALVVVSDLSELPTDQWQDRVTRYQDRTGVRVTVVDAQARVVTDSEGDPPGTSFSRPEFDRALAGEIVNGVRFSRTLDTQLRNVAVPIRDESQILGAARLSVPESVIDDQVRRLMWAFVTILVAVLAAALVAGWALARALSRPLGRLAARRRSGWRRPQREGW